MVQNLERRGGGAGPDPAFPLLFHDNSASQTSVICASSTGTLSQHCVVYDFGESRIPTSSQSRIPSRLFSFSRIPLCILVKSRVPKIPFQGKALETSVLNGGLQNYRAFSHDVTAAILVSQNNETAAMLVSQTNPVGVELFSYVNSFFCSNKFA